MEEDLEKSILPRLIKDLGMIFATENSKRGYRHGLYKCGFCGKDFEARISHVNSGHTISCGCQQYKIAHGLSRNKFYDIWRQMMARCNNTKSKNYRDYGGRGITVCEDWKDITTFINWCEETFIENMSLDRKDNDRGYEPENCRWVDKTTQAINQRKKKNNTSGYIGVSFNKRNDKWTASIRINNKLYHIGSYDTLIAAAQARDLYIVANNLPHKLNFEIEKG